jgi:hypothetical protein
VSCTKVSDIVTSFVNYEHLCVKCCQMAHGLTLCVWPFLGRHLGNYLDQEHVDREVFIGVTVSSTGEALSRQKSSKLLGLTGSSTQSNSWAVSTPIGSVKELLYSTRLEQVGFWGDHSLHLALVNESGTTGQVKNCPDLNIWPKQFGMVDMSLCVMLHDGDLAAAWFGARDIASAFVGVAFKMFVLNAAHSAVYVPTSSAYIQDMRPFVDSLAVGNSYIRRFAVPEQPDRCLYFLPSTLRFHDASTVSYCRIAAHSDTVFFIPEQHELPEEIYLNVGDSDTMGSRR